MTEPYSLEKASAPTERHRIVQFNDGRLGILKDTTGQTESWRGKYTRNITHDRSYNSAVVTLASGIQFGLRNGVIVQLPKLDETTGRYPEDGQIFGRDIRGVELPELTIGENWSFLGLKDPVKEVLVGYKSTAPGDSRYDQKDSISPFGGVEIYLTKAAETLHGYESQSQSPLGFVALSGTVAPRSSGLMNRMLRRQ